MPFKPALVALLLALLLMSSCAEAGMVITGDNGLPQYFLHINSQRGKVTHLPRNARGVLFVSPPSLKMLHVVTENGEPVGILTSRPHPLRAEDFFVARADRTLLPVQIKPLPQGLGSAGIEDGRRIPHWPRRFYLAADEHQKICSMDWAHAATSPECRLAGIDPDVKDWAHKLVTLHRLTDVTAEAQASMGLFRIEPKGGFPGSGTFFAGRFYHPKDTWLRPYMTIGDDKTDWTGTSLFRRGVIEYYGYAIVIDPDPIDLRRDAFSLTPSGEAHTGGTAWMLENHGPDQDCRQFDQCEARQDVSIATPAFFDNYRDSAVYFLIARDFDTKQDEREKPAWHYAHDDQFSFGSLGDVHAQGMPRLDYIGVYCGDAAIDTKVELGMEVGLLEVSDELFVIKAGEFSIKAPKGMCSAPHQPPPVPAPVLQ